MADAPHLLVDAPTAAHPNGAVQRTCPACGDPVPPSRGKKPRTWCSPACWHWARRHPGEKRVKDRRCAACGADISHLFYKAKVCSKRCDGVLRGNVRLEPLPPIPCTVCGTTFVPRRADAKYCSDKCRQRRPRVYGPRKPRPYSDKDRDRDQRKRARKKGAATGRPVRKTEIAERDRWRCGICCKPVDPALQWPHPMSASLDHIDPLSLGGPHDPANVRLAHLGCNTARGNRGGGEQLMLIG